MTKFKRKTKQKATAILTADWHIRADVPICRTDDFFQAMSDKLDFILNLSKEHDCPILLAGDLGKRPLNRGWPTWLLEWTINKLFGSNIIAIPGQHDLPGHRLDLFKESGMGVITAAGAIDTITDTFFQIEKGFNLIGFPYSIELHSRKIERKVRNDPVVAMTHQMVIEDKQLWPGQEAPKGNALLKKYPEYALILSGDNHNPFTCEYQGRRLVNPGSLMRTSADQINHKPRVYLWFAESNDIEAVYLPIKDNVISRTHIEVAKDRENRNEAFITRCNNMEDLEIDYEDNLASYFKQFKTQIPVKNKVMAAVE